MHWAGSSIVQPPQLGEVRGEQEGAAAVGTDPSGMSISMSAAGMQPGCRMLQGAGAGTSKEPCPQRVPQPGAGTAAASDSCGGRAL